MPRVLLQEQTRYSALTFRRLLDSLARPGKINQLVYPHFVGEPPCYHVQASATAISVNLYALGALLTLLDKEVTFAVSADGQWLSHATPLVQWLLLKCGSSLSMPESAMFAFFCQGSSSGLVTQLNRGTLIEPESSTTAFYCVERLTAWTAELEENPDQVTLELTGPGIENTQRVCVLGMESSEIRLLHVVRQGYPLGIDVYLVDDLGYCVGLPRTTNIHLPGKEC